VPTTDHGTTGHDEATLRQIRAIEEYVAVEPSVSLLYCAEREASIPPPEAFDRALRLAMPPDGYERVRHLFTGGMDTGDFEGRFALDNLMTRAEAYWRSHRPVPSEERPG
jgi:hypothetical protein